MTLFVYLIFELLINSYYLCQLILAEPLLLLPGGHAGRVGLGLLETSSLLAVSQFVGVDINLLIEITITIDHMLDF